jgi:hypothetical protein
MNGPLVRRMSGERRNSCPAGALIPSERGWRSMGTPAGQTSGGHP